MTLREIREKIDALDDALIRLLNERADLVHEIGLVKRAEGAEIYAPEREEMLLRALAARNAGLRGRLPEKSIRAIYREIMSASLALEKDLAIAHFDTEQTHRAARSKFGASVAYTPRASIAEVFAAVADGAADYGVVPLEDALEGAADHTLDAFMESELRICAQILLPADDAPQTLLASGPAATGAARFLVLGRRASPPTGDDHTALLFCVEDGTRVPELFARLQIRVSKIESRRASRTARECVFFVDLDGHAGEPEAARAIAALEPHCTFIKVLGTYPKTAPA